MTTTPPSGPTARRTGSHTSLNHLTLGPLSTGRPLVESSDYDDAEPPSHSYASSPPRRRSSSFARDHDDDIISPAPTAPFQYHYQRDLSRPSSYIAARSVPTTPGILSRSHSPARTPKPGGAGGLGGSKSSSHLMFGDGNSAASGATTPGSSSATATAPTDLGAAVAGKTKRQRDRDRLRQNRESSEWLYRHGAALTDSARDSKGQSWLVSRASSTSMAYPDVEGVARQASKSPELGRKSARHSRHTSRVSLRDLGMTSAGGVGVKKATQMGATSEASDYFSNRSMARGVEGPDFVNAHDDEEEEDDDGVGHDEAVEEETERRIDDAEIARLARESQNGLGFGGLVDRLVGWSLFDVGSGESRREGEEEVMKKEHETRLKRVRDSQAELARLVKAEQLRMREKGKAKENVKAEGEGSGWNDAAWLLSVASKVIF